MSVYIFNYDELSEQDKSQQGFLNHEVVTSVDLNECRIATVHAAEGTLDVFDVDQNNSRASFPDTDQGWEQAQQWIWDNKDLLCEIADNQE